MTDIFDQASDIEEQHRELSIRAARFKNQPIKFTGRCLYCNEEVSNGRFCYGGDCKEDWEFEQKISKIKGLR